MERVGLGVTAFTLCERRAIRLCSGRVLSGGRGHHGCDGTVNIRGQNIRHKIQCSQRKLDVKASLIMNCLEYIYSSVLQIEKLLKRKRSRRRTSRKESVKRENRECTANNRRAENDRIEHNVKATDFAVAEGGNERAS